MAFGEATILAFATAFTGILSFIFGIVAENKKPASGTPTQQDGLTVCVYPSDPYVPLGALSVVLLVVASILGCVSIFYPYSKKAVPLAALARSKILVVFTCLSVLLFFVAEGLLLWATMTESLHRSHNVHSMPTCPTAKTGLMGGAAFLALDTTLFWLVCQMLTMNAREDHLELYEEDGKGSYGQVVSADYTAVAPHPATKA